MKKSCIYLLIFSLLLSQFNDLSAQQKPDTLMYHPVQTDKNGFIIPWYAAEPGRAYDHILKLLWQYWQNLPECLPGIKWYLMHRQVIVSNSNYIPKGGHDDGIGGDQIAMAMSSWRNYYAYTGDTALIRDMVYMADHYLKNGLSPADYKWPEMPFVCNPGRDHDIRYQGDWVVDYALYKTKAEKAAHKELMEKGDGYLQPDKAGSFAYEMVMLFKMTGSEKYLNAAVKIANTLAKFTKPGNKENSPLPFRVQAKTGIIYPQTDYVTSTYTSNWTATIMLFDELIALKRGNTASYSKARDVFIDFLKNIVVKYDLYGPFFEDIPMWSNTQINAGTLARYILLQKEKWGSTWRADARHILDWATKTFRHDKWKKYGVTVIGEQTVYNSPGNSHTARQAAVELLYCATTGDMTNRDSAICQLNWATYMVDTDGKNCYPNNEVWLTDGYGDYVRHYLWAMAAVPELAPSDADHMLESSSVVQSISYSHEAILYKIFDKASHDIFRLVDKPARITVNGKLLKEKMKGEGWRWQPLDKGGILTIDQKQGDLVKMEM